MLKNNNSKINSLNDFYYKSKLKNSKNISILIAFNVTTRDVICSLPYSGNCIDITSFPDFLEKTGINRVIIIGDKGINCKEIVTDIGFIYPLKRSSKLLEEIDAYNMTDKLNDKEDPTWCKKVFHKGLYYYSFRNLKKATKEE